MKKHEKISSDIYSVGRKNEQSKRDSSGHLIKNIVFSSKKDCPVEVPLYWYLFTLSLFQYFRVKVFILWILCSTEISSTMDLVPP